MPRVLLTLALLTAAVLPAAAQSSGNIVLSTYYECDPNLEAAIDDVVMQSVAPIHQRHVDSGDLIAWGWNAHVLGGPWRRFIFLIAPDVDTGLDLRSEILQEIQTEEPAAARLVNSVCPRHEDYIWSVNQASQAATPGPAPTPTMTTYYSCAQGSAGEADSAFRDAVAPALEDLVRDEELSGWAWLAHVSGGTYRRAVVLAGQSAGAILGAQQTLAGSLSGVEAANRLLDLCSSHVDYHWSPATQN